MDTSPLFTPCEIGRLAPRNRICFPAFHLGLAEDGLPSTPLLAFYDRLSRGGVGAVIVGVCNTAPGAETRLKRYLDLSRDEAVEPMARLAETIRRRGAVAGIQLSPLSGYNQPAWHPPVEGIAPIVADVGRAGRRAVEAGFDLVELMLSGGSLLSHFLSPAHNRWDLPGYSGGWEERLRAPLEAVAALRENLAGDAVLAVRMHGHEHLTGGYDQKGARRIADALADAGVDVLDVTGAGHRTEVPQLTAENPPRAFAELAAGIREAVDLPLLTGGRVRLPEEALETLRVSGASMVTVARALVVDPEWPNKAAAGRDADIIPCMVCGRCLDGAFTGRSLSCSLNPHISTPSQGPRPTEARQTALVIGGGPAGLQAAWELARRGFETTVLERNQEPGGRWRSASRLRGRGHLTAPLGAFIRRLERSGARVESGVTATPELVRERGPDLLVLATGARPRRLDIPGAGSHPHVVRAEEIIGAEDQVGQKVAVIGAGGVGVEIAIHLGETREITLLRRRGYAGRGLGGSTRWALLGELERAGVRVVDRCEYGEITPEGLRIFNRREEAEELVPADTIIVAAGYEPDPELLARFAGTAPRIAVAGDADHVANVGEAIHCAHTVVAALDDE